MKSSFQSNPGPTVLGGFRTTRLSDSSHDNVLLGEGVLIFLSEIFLCQTWESNPGHLDRQSCVLTTVLPLNYEQELLFTLDQ